ncbi:AfsA-related hotdog domain-containing protein [Streptomyces sp. SBT349]|uniref:AfsA-related hotdog domain-containing protein n=1 Tax=Streptomyces sp. SBT349 TaxID=1580539 RepID=UPI00066A7BA3|nr:AfsA-related hotdog domain-containing protein [Streptomyces sp. SBT349]
MDTQGMAGLMWSGDGHGRDDCGRDEPGHRLVRVVHEGDGTMTATARPPGGHPFFRDLAARADPRYLVEVGHQLFMLHLLRSGRRATRRPSLVRRFTVMGGAALRPDAALDVALRYRWTRSGDDVERAVAVMTAHQCGRPVGRAESTILVVERDVLMATRVADRGSATGGPPCVDTRSTGVRDPAAVGRVRAHDVLLDAPPRPADGGSAAHLLVPSGHDFFFDPPVDHVPGAALLEGFLQLGTAAGLVDRPTRVASRFVRFCETDRPCLLTAHRDDGAATARMTAWQAGAVVAHATVF